MQTIARLIRFAAGPRLRTDLGTLLRHWGQRQPDILFVAGSQVDLQWVLPTYREAIARGLRCSIAGPALRVPPGASYLDISMHVLRFLRTRLMVTATSGLKASMMPRRCERRVAVPHSLVSFHMAYPKGTFDPYTDVFCCGDHHRDEIEALNRKDGIRNRRPVLVGYGKYETDAPVTVPAIERRGRGHVLIGPSWGPDNILQRIGEPLVARLLAEGYTVTLRPHPSFFVFGDALLAPLVEAMGRHPGFTLEESTGSSAALWTADFMISDYSGFAMEFAFLRKKPVLYIAVPPKIMNPDWQDIPPVPLELSVRDRIGVIARPEMTDVMQALSRLESEAALWEQRIEQTRLAAWANFGQFARVSCDELQHMLQDRPVQDD